MTLPGMPIRAGDPGVFICGPGDIAPWETETPAKRDPAPRRAQAGPRSWIVLRDCPACGPRYCDRHGPRNWWLTEYNGPPFGRRIGREHD